jgi:putative FmdB family regulatory protein
MPIYEFRCDPCAHAFEELRAITETTVPACPRCGAMTRRLISATSFVLKGSGWYATDYKPTVGGSKASEG